MNKLIYAFLLLSGLIFPQESIFSNLSQSSELMPVNGKYAGQYVENIDKRTPVLLSFKQKSALNLDPDDLYIANIKHRGKFYIAKFKGVTVDSENNFKTINSVTESVHYIKEKWNAGKRPEIQELEAHSSLLIKFLEGNGLELVIDQIDFEESGYQLSSTMKPVLLKEIVISLEAIRGMDSLDAAFLPDGILENFALGIRVYSETERVERRGGDLSLYEDEFFQLDLTQVKSTVFGPLDIGGVLLYNALKVSSDVERSQPYTLFSNNCTNRLFDLLNFSLVLVKDNKSIEEDLIEGMKKSIEVEGVAILDFMEELSISKIKDIDNSMIEAMTNDLFVLFKLIRENRNILSSFIHSNNLVGDYKKAKEYLYSFPIFIEDHLSARGLVLSREVVTYE